jgi:2,4-diketo-3-deoxy-L-fuconate hydrolase
MKLLRYGAPGAEKPGLLDAQGRVRDLSAIVPDICGETLLPESLQALRNLDVASLPVVAGIPQQDLRLGACVGNIGKFICIGLNYADHAEEAGMPIPPEPIIFGKWTSAVCGPNDPIQIPRGSIKTDWEVELGVVIGKPGYEAGCASSRRNVADLATAAFTSCSSGRAGN